MKHFVLLLPVMCLLFLYSSYAQNTKTISGVVIDKYETKEGTITIQYPERLTSGRKVSGRILVEPKSDNPSREKKQLSKLLLYTISFGELIPVKDGNFVSQLPITETLPVKVMDAEGKVVKNSLLKLTEDIGSQNLHIPNTIKAKNIERITGSFTGDINQTKLKIDDKSVELIAGSESELFYKISEVHPGKHNLELDCGDVQEDKRVNLVDYSLNAGRLNLNKGEQTYLNVKIMGMDDIVDTLILTVKNESATTISLEGGDNQIIEILPHEVAESGIWEREFEVQSLRKGSFSVQTNLEVVEIKKPDTMSGQKISISEDYDKQIVESTSTELYTNEIVRKLEINKKIWERHGELLKLNKSKPNQEDLTLLGKISAPCDTLTVDSLIRFQINSITKNICDIDSKVLDQLLKAIDEYEKASWKRDSLHGVLNTLKEFSFKNLNDNSISEIEKQIQQLRNMTPESANCATNWENDFRKRYLGANQGRTEYQKIYDRKVKEYKERFEKCKAQSLKNLEKEKKSQVDDFKQFNSKGKEQIDGATNLLATAEQNASNKQKELEKHLKNLKDELCRVKIEWEVLIAYMDSNLICIKCDTSYHIIPNEMHKMNGCLTYLESLIKKKIREIRKPLDLGTLKRIANNHFDLSEMKYHLNKLDSLKEVYKINNSPENLDKNLKLVFPCCDDFYDLSTGVYLWGHTISPHSPNLESLAKRLGMGIPKLVVVPADPVNYKNGKTQKDYFKQRSDFLNKQNIIRQKIDRNIKRLISSGNSTVNSMLKGLRDEKAIKLHGAVQASTMHTQSADNLQKLLEHSLKEMADCYNTSIQNQQQQAYVGIHHKCFEFKKCLEKLDEEFENYQKNLNEVEDTLKNRCNLLLNKIEKVKKELETIVRILEGDGKISKLKAQIDQANSEISHLSNTESSELNKRIAELKKNILQLNNKFKKLQNEKGNLKNEFNKLVEKSNELIRELKKNDFKKPGDNFSDRNVKNNESCEDLRKEINEAAQDLANKKGDIQRKINELSRGLNKLLEDKNKASKNDSIISSNKRKLYDNADELKSGIKKIDEEIKREKAPKIKITPQPYLKEEIKASDKQLKFQAQVKLKHLYNDYLTSVGPCDCKTKAIALAYNTNTIVNDIIGKLAVDVALAPLHLFPGISLAGRLGIGIVKTILCNIYGGESFSDQLIINLSRAIGGELFPKLTGNQFIGKKLNNLARRGLSKILKEEGVRFIQWEGSTTLKSCGKVSGKTTLFINSKTGWVAIMVKIPDCPLVVIKYKVNNDGVPITKPKILEL